MTAGSDSPVDSDDELTFTMSHHPCAFPTSLLTSAHSCDALIASEVVPQPSPDIQQQPREPPVSTASYWVFSS